MKTHRTCGECRNSKPYDEQDFPLLCKKTGISIYANDSCSDFVPKQNSICDIVSSTIEIGRRTIENLADRLEAAAKKAATTGNRHDLQEYLKLRREIL